MIKTVLKIFITSIVGSTAFIQLFDSVAVNFNGIEFMLAIKMALKGFTAVFLPPLGILKAYTHCFPVQVNVTLQHINLDFAKSLIEQAQNKDQLLTLFKTHMSTAAYRICVKTIILSTLGAAITAFIFRFNLKHIVTCAAVGLLVGAIITASLFLTYDINAFNNPEYSGTLKAAPWIINMINKGLDQINELGNQLKNISDNITTVFSNMNEVNPIETGESDNSIVRVLHVSDIHNNPAAFDFMEQIVKNFRIDFIIDTGDITDYGTPVEELLLQNLSRFKVYYVFIPGNHDSPEIINVLKNLKNITVLDGQMINIKGINLMGFADPVSTSKDIDVPEEMKILETNLKIRELLKEIPKTPDILAVHNPKVTENLVGKIPVILNGHMHELDFKEKNGSVKVNAGTTGAAGIRGFQKNNEVPYSAVVLYFKKSDNSEENNKIVAADVIKISNIKAGFKVERVFFNQEGP